MLNGKFVSYKAAMAELLNDHPWIEGNYTEEDLLRSVREVIRLVGGVHCFMPTIDFLEVENSMVDIPKDMYYIQTIASTPYSTIEEAEAAACAGALKLQRMRFNGDEMQRKWYCSTADFKHQSNIAYMLAGNKILPNFKHGIIVIAYLTELKDDEGLPMIPDNESWMKAVVYTTLLRIATRMLMTNKMADNNYNRIEQNKIWYTAQAGTVSKGFIPDERIAMRNNNLSWPMDVYSEQDFFNSYNRTKRISR